MSNGTNKWLKTMVKQLYQWLVEILIAQAGLRVTLGNPRLSREACTKLKR